MKYLFLSILMIGVGFGVVGCEDDKDDPPQEEAIELNGRVSAVYSEDDSDCEYNYDGDGCSSRSVVLGYVIISDDRIMYNPGDSLPKEYKIHGLNVWVRAEDMQKYSAWGQVIRIIEIERR